MSTRATSTSKRGKGNAGLRSHAPGANVDAAPAPELDADGEAATRPPTRVTTLGPRARARDPLPLQKNHHPLENHHPQADHEVAPEKNIREPHDAGTAVPLRAGAPAPDAVDAKADRGGADTPGIWSTIVETYRDRPIAFVEDLLIRNYPDFKIE